MTVQQTEKMKKDTTGERWRDHELREDRRGIRIGIKDPLCPDL